MTRLANTTGTVLRGIRPDENVTVETVKWHGADVVEIIHKGSNSVPGTQLLYRDMESTLDLVEAGRESSSNLPSAPACWA